METFKFDGQATIRHINTRKEGPEDDKNLAVDVKLNGTVDWTAWDFFHEDLRPVLYTDVGAAKNCMMESIGFAHSVRNCSMTILERTFQNVEVKNFKLRPTDGFKAEITFSATITPDGDDIGLLAEYLQEEVAVKIEPQPDLFDGAVEKEVAEAAA